MTARMSTPPLATLANNSLITMTSSLPHLGHVDAEERHYSP